MNAKTWRRQDARVTPSAKFFGSAGRHAGRIEIVASHGLVI